MNAKSAFSLKPRMVITPLGEGELIGVDNKKDPREAIVLVRVEGYKLRVAKTFDISELKEVDDDK